MMTRNAYAPYPSACACIPALWRCAALPEGPPYSIPRREVYGRADPAPAPGAPKCLTATPNPCFALEPFVPVHKREPTSAYTPEDRGNAFFTALCIRALLPSTIALRGGRGAPTWPGAPRDRRCPPSADGREDYPISTQLLLERSLSLVLHPHPALPQELRAQSPAPVAATRETVVLPAWMAIAIHPRSFTASRVRTGARAEGGARPRQREIAPWRSLPGSPWWSDRPGKARKGTECIYVA
ncbi:hypothetical protein DFH06DRAFT_72570 [Mycena polygramma]|nr:hypothetical protein DFH06DRAFT_72570 [Mycena polygramma]